MAPDLVSARILGRAKVQARDYAADLVSDQERGTTMAKGKTEKLPGQDLETAKAAARDSAQALVVAAAAMDSAARALQDQAQALAAPDSFADRADQAIEAAEGCLAAAETAARDSAALAAAAAEATAAAAQAADQAPA